MKNLLINLLHLQILSLYLRGPGRYFCVSEQGSAKICLRKKCISLILSGGHKVLSFYGTSCAAMYHSLCFNCKDMDKSKKARFSAKSLLSPALVWLDMYFDHSSIVR